VNNTLATYTQQIQDVQDNTKFEHIGAILIFQTSGHDVQYPGHSHDHRQLHDNREMIHQAVRATCLDILHVVPVFVEVNGSHQEADDVNGDEHDDDQVVVEELRGLEESFL